MELQLLFLTTVVFMYSTILWIRANQIIAQLDRLEELLSSDDDPEEEN